MKQIEIQIPKKTFFPGDIITGKAILTCDENFHCRSGLMVISGRMYEQDFIGTGGSITTTFQSEGRETQVQTILCKDESWILHREMVTFTENKEFTPGIYEFDIKFQLPDDLQPSYKYVALRVDYGIGVVMEISDEERVETSKKVIILSPWDDTGATTIEEGFLDPVGKAIRVRLNSRQYCVGDDISFSYHVDSGMVFDSLKFEIKYYQKMKISTRACLMREEKNSEDITRDEWVSWDFSTKDRSDFTTLSTDNVQTCLSLEISVINGEREDTIIKIPLYARHCIKDGNVMYSTEIDEADPLSINQLLVPIQDEVSKDEHQAERLVSDDKQRVARNWYQKAVSFKDRGEIEHATKAIKKSLQWDPDNEDARALSETLKNQDQSN